MLLPIDIQPPRETVQSAYRINREVQAYFCRIVAENALPPMKARWPLMLHKKEARDRLRQAIYTILQEGDCHGKDYDSMRDYIARSFASMEGHIGVNPYRDASLHLLQHLNHASYLIETSRKYPFSQRLRRIQKNLRKPIVTSMTQLYGKEISQLLGTCFPRINAICLRGIRK